MTNTRVLGLVAVISAVLIACGSSQAQDSPLASTSSAQGNSASAEVTLPSNGTASAQSPLFQRMPRTVAPQTRAQGKPMSIDDLLSGITLSEEQKPKIEQVRKDMRTRMDTVIHDKNENQDQKQAMLQGLQHMELREVYQLLTLEQQSTVRKRIAAQRTSQPQSQRSPQESQPR